ncbi:MAG: hypothetical protein R3324_02345 [Halobacteriales archaeon]|nr:hypothetical protein [Halobacteriales archaeon]
MEGEEDGRGPSAEDRREEFAVRITDSALEANDSAAEYARRYGAVVTFDSRSAAAELASMFTTSGGTPVVVQAAAPQDGSDIDAYLVARPTRRTHDPSGSIETALTFDTTATQFGALGETLITCYGANPPLLLHFVREDLGRKPDDPLHVDVDADPAPVTVGGPAGNPSRSWVPDCRAVARPEPGGRVLRTYLCEIKTGGGSLERDQLAVMQAITRRTPVLKIQLDISELPESYTARVRRVTATEDGDDDAARDDSALSVNARLDEYS